MDRVGCGVVVLPLDAPAPDGQVWDDGSVITWMRLVIDGMAHWRPLRTPPVKEQER